MKIKTKLLTLPLLMATLAFVAATTFGLHSFKKNSLEQLNIKQQQLVRSIKLAVDGYIQNHMSALELLQTMEPVKDTSDFASIQTQFRGVSDQESLELRQLFKNTIGLYPDFAYLETFTKDKAINVVLEPYQAQLNITEENFLRGFSYRDWYKGAMANNGIYVSEAYVSASIMEPVVAISTPIFNEQQVVGIMIGALRLTNLSEIVRSFSYGQTGITYLIDKNHNMVAHADDKYFAERSLFSVIDNELTDYVVNNPDQSKGTMRLYDQLTGSEVFASFKKIDTTDWYVITQISTAEAISPVIDTLTTTSLVAAFTLLAYLAYLYFNTHGLIRPIGFLSSISDQVAEDNLPKEAVQNPEFSKYKQRDDEIGKLVSSYHIMVKRLHENFEKQQTYNKEVEYLANHDQLTSLPNRRQFHAELMDRINRGTSGAVIIMDLDDFKLINDTMGHVFGDKVLLKVAAVLQSISGDNCLISRMNGDEFNICVENTGTDNQVGHYLNQINDAFSKPIIIDGVNLDVRFSLGVALFPQDGDDINRLMKCADLALYSVKKQGKNHCRYFSKEMEDQVLARANVEQTLRQALREDAFRIVYQPQVDIHTGQITAYEALLRLPNSGLSPGHFIPVAEENGMIVQIGRLVVEKVIEDIALWLKQGFDVKPVAINYSAVQMQDKLFIDDLKAWLNKHQISPSLITLEVTENIFVGKMHDAVTLLNTMTQAGIRIAIDDFGTGYSSLSYLTSLPIYKVKLDRSLSKKFLTPDHVDTITSLIALAHSLDLIVVAEGIENYQDIRTLANAKCDQVQGFYFSKPIGREEMPQSMRSNFVGKLSA